MNPDSGSAFSRPYLDFTEIEAKRRAESPGSSDIRYSGFTIAPPSRSAESMPLLPAEEIKRAPEVHPAVAIGLVGAVVLVPLLIALLANKSKPASLPAPLDG